MEDRSEPKHLVTGGSSFRWNGYLYRLLQPGQDFLEEDGFSSYAETVQRTRQSGKPVVLSIGESSTSGWDTTVTPENRRRRYSTTLSSEWGPMRWVANGSKSG